jgi:hypothetical protein
MTEIVKLDTLSSFQNEIERLTRRQNYTRNEWRRCQNTLATSGEDVKTHSQRVEKI